jgi:hypothetical protein
MIAPRSVAKHVQSMKRNETIYDPGASWPIPSYLHADLKITNAHSYDGRINLLSARTKRACRHMATITVTSTHSTTPPGRPTARPLEQEGGSNKDGTRTIRDQQYV